MPAKGSETPASVRGSEGRSPYTRVDSPERESARHANAHAGCRGGHSFRQNHAQDIARAGAQGHANAYFAHAPSAGYGSDFRLRLLHADRWLQPGDRFHPHRLKAVPERST